MIKLERLHLISRADMLKPFRVFTRGFLSNLGCDAKTVDCLVLAINEACMNVIQHAYSSQNNEEIIIEFWRDEDELIVKILDNAVMLDVDLIRSRALEDIRPGGLGVHFINQVMDKVQYNNRTDKQGNMLEMSRNLYKPADCCMENKDK